MTETPETINLTGFLIGLIVGSLAGGLVGSWIRAKIERPRRDPPVRLGARRWINPETGLETGDRPGHLGPGDAPLGTGVGDPLG